MSKRERFIEKDPIFASQYPDFLADEATIKNQPCKNWRCRGNVDYCCVYQANQYNVCCDKEASEDSFFKYD